MPENDLVLKSIDGVFSFALCLFMSFSPYVLKSHESFTYVSPDVFSVSHKSLIVNILQEIVRVSFSAPNASHCCEAFLFVGRMDNGIPALACTLLMRTRKCFSKGDLLYTSPGKWAYRWDWHEMRTKNQT